MKSILVTPILVALLLVACGGRSSVVGEFEFEGSGMEPTISHGDKLTVVEYGDDKPQRGDIISFALPDAPPGQERLFFKRVIALPGETVEIRDGRVYIEGEPLEEPYIVEPPTYTYGPEAVPPNHYFVLGDNRNNSADSHTWGPLPAENIIGKGEVQ